jgi:hypothetical protein
MRDSRSAFCQPRKVWNPSAQIFIPVTPFLGDSWVKKLCQKASLINEAQDHGHETVLGDYKWHVAGCAIMNIHVHLLEAVQKNGNHSDHVLH